MRRTLFDQLARFRVHLTNRFCVIPFSSNVILRDYRVVLGDYIGKPKPRHPWLSGVPLLSQGFRPPSGGHEEPKSEARRAENACLRQRVLFAAQGPRGCAPLETPGRGCPLHRMPICASATDPAGGLSPRGRGAGEERPRHPAGRLGSSGRVRGRVLAPTGLRAAPTLDPPFTENAPEARAGAWRGTAGVDGGQGSRSDPRSGLALTPRNDPHAPGWWLGCFSPAACHVANAPGGRRRRS